MKILIVDDHQLFVDGMRYLLKKLLVTKEVEEAFRAEDAIRILESGKTFDLVLIDLCMPGMSGLSVLRRMRAQGIYTPVVVVSAEEDITKIHETLTSGASGFIPKTHNGEQMRTAFEAVLAGEVYIPPDIEKRLAGYDARRTLDCGSITRRQREVLRLLAQGYSNKQIAATFYLTEHTVKAHVAALLKATKTSSRTECVHVASSRGLL
ncbi:response regulator [Marinobacter caseinilyticus]|uniref:response regulator n=1 Tax=Marinobacter caseinilyticus TaxID=2692195 RepID=UPI001F168ECC|nr:response regulator transcription factor [Marinobacter caseinilyticus]